MTLRKAILHSGISALLAIAASVIYNQVYSKALDLNFTAVLNTGGIIGACIFGCVLLGTAYYVGYRWKGARSLGWINLIAALLSFASIIGIFGFQLPFEIESPELFPGLAIPMHFFPAFSFFAIAPFFKYQ